MSGDSDPQARVEAERRRLIEGRMSVQEAEAFLKALEEESVELADREVEIRLEQALGGEAPLRDPKGALAHATRIIDRQARELAARASSPAPDAELRGMLEETLELIEHRMPQSDRRDGVLNRGRAVLAAVASSPVPEDDRIDKAVGLLNAARIGAECTGQHGSVQLFGELIEILSAGAAVASSPVPAGNDIFGVGVDSTLSGEIQRVLDGYDHEDWCGRSTGLDGGECTCRWGYAQSRLLQLKGFLDRPAPVSVGDEDR